MTTDATPSATWDSMTDQQKVEWLATEVMGWEAKDNKRCACLFWMCGEIRMYRAWCSYVCEEHDGIWDPLTDWNHWRQVEVEMMEDKVFWHRVMETFGEAPFMAYMQSDLATRARSLCVALDSLK